LDLGGKLMRLLVRNQDKKNLVTCKLAFRRIKSESKSKTLIIII